MANEISHRMISRTTDASGNCEIIIPPPSWEVSELYSVQLGCPDTIGGRLRVLIRQDGDQFQLVPYEPVETLGHYIPWGGSMYMRPSDRIVGQANDCGAFEDIVLSVSFRQVGE